MKEVKTFEEFINEAKINEAKSSTVKKIMELVDEIDAEGAEELMYTMSKWYSDAAEDLTNMNAKKIADYLHKAGDEIKRRTGN